MLIVHLVKLQTNYNFAFEYLKVDTLMVWPDNLPKIH